MRRFNAKSIAATAAAVALIAGCQPAFKAVEQPTLSIDTTPAVLLEPQGLDWTAQRISSRRITTERDAHFQRSVLAYPTASTNWAGGVALSSLGAAGDTVPNGPAAAFRTNPADPLYNKLFLLSRNGRFIKVDRANPTGAPVALPLAKTFSRTFVTLSPASSRAYLLADDGTLFIVNTITMSTVATLTLPAGGYGIAPVIDPVLSAHNDLRDELFVPCNNGQVYHYTVEATSTTSGVTTTPAVAYNVSGAVTPLAGTNKIAAPAVVFNGVIYVGDQAGNFKLYDTYNTANNLTFGVGAPVNTAPAIEIQDGTYALTDPNGAPKAVSPGTPIYAFVSAGAGCAWINLHDTSITRSQGLRIDDNDNGRKFGFLLDYNYSNTGTTVYLAARDGGNINTDTTSAPANRILPNYTTNWSNDYIVPAESNVYDDGTQAAGGPVLSYLRFQDTVARPAGSIVNSATLTLSPFADQSCRVPEVKLTEPYYKSTATLWASNGLTTANRPTVTGGNIGVYLSGGVNGSGNVPYKDNKRYVWDVTSAFNTPMTHYALSMNYNAGGDAVLWPWGPYNGATGTKGKSKKAYQVDSVMFRNNPLNANPAAGTAADTRPLLTLQISAATLPTPSIETPPVIDALRKKVYVFYTNALYELDFAQPSYWSDTDSTGAKHTLFNLAHYGDTANGGGGAFNGNTKFVGNFTAPVVNYNLTSLYAVSRYPAPDVAAPTTWNYALSKFNLPLSSAANRLVAGSPTFTGLNPEASSYMLVDPFTNAGTTGGNVYFALGNGRVYQYDR
jgi:hypothetical protein